MKAKDSLHNSALQRLPLIILFALVAFISSTYAGDTGPYKQMAPAQSEVFGRGWYFGLDGGANIYQDRGGDFTISNQAGDTLHVSPKDNVGFFGGLKAGYVFGTGMVRPALEADFFYNGFRGGADTTLTINGVQTRESTGTSYINTGAFMLNGLLKFGTGRFQPYIGAGVGGYYAESAGFDLNLPRNTFSTSGGKGHGDFAFQALAGADYYWGPTWSTFLEYHFLYYTSSHLDTFRDRDLGQHLLGAGLRFHF
jgi:hypothetical protein